LKRDRPELLKPIELFGTRAGYRELDAERFLAHPVRGLDQRRDLRGRVVRGDPRRLVA